MSLSTAHTMLLEWYTINHNSHHMVLAILHNEKLMLDNIEIATVLEDSTVKTKVCVAHHKFSAHH